MNALSKNKSLIALALFIFAGVLAYRLLSPGVESLSQTESAKEVGKDLINLYDDLSRATLSSTIFSTATYRNLVDFTASSTRESYGRRNPFDLIGRE